MMRALLVIDVQNGIVGSANFQKELQLIENVIKDFKKSGDQVIFMKHYDVDDESQLSRNSVGSELHHSLKDYADYVIEKQTPSSFFNTQLSSILGELGVDHLFITGFETEFCCMFTAISAYDRGYKVTFIKDATGALNNQETYQMPGLDINGFVSKVLQWSNVIQVIDYEEYCTLYNY